MKFSINFIFYFLIIILLNLCQSKKIIEVEFLNKNKKLEHIKIEIENNPLGEGTNALIFYGRLKSSIIKSVNGKRINEVAVKIYKNHQENIYIINEIKILETFNKLPFKQREGIIELYLHGIIKSKLFESIEEKEENKKVLILEYGENLYERIKNVREYLNEEYIWKEFVKKTILAINDLHRLIIHLDLKPLNMVYTKNTIKIIDFESGHLIQNELEINNNNNNKLANKYILIDEQYTTQIYRGPENNIICDGEFSCEFKYKTKRELLSTKSDIWSIGITFLEYILESPLMEKPLEIFRFLRGPTNNLKIIKELNLFYKLNKNEWNKRIKNSYKIMKLNNEIEIKKEKEKRKLNINTSTSTSTSNNNYNIENNIELLKPPKESYLAYIILILQIQKVHPLLFRMITASLEYNQEDRPSSLGLLNFMSGKCYFKHEINKTKKYSKKPIFIIPKLILNELDLLKKRKEEEIKKFKPLSKSVTSIDNEEFRKNEQNEIINKIIEIKNEVLELLNKIIQLENKENEEKWNCFKFFISCFRKNKKTINVENNKTKIDLRRLKWDETTIEHKPENIECDTENIDKSTYLVKGEIFPSEMSGYEGDFGDYSSLSLPTTPLMQQNSSSPITDYDEENKLLVKARSWSATPKREEYSSNAIQESDWD